MRKKLIISLFLLFSWSAAVAQLNVTPAEVRDIGVTEMLGDKVPMDITFRDEDGDVVTLGDYLAKGKPIILTPIYFECPSLCNLILNGVTEGLSELNWQIGDQFEVITFSINPEETPELASDKKKSYLRLLGKPEAADGWHFLTMEESEITRLTDAIGFHFKWSEEAQEYLHGSAIMFISPDGTITRYLYGVYYPELALRNALFDAAEGRIGSVMERVMLYCFTYDPDSRSYVPYAVNIMKIGGLLTVSFLGIFLGLLRFRKGSKNINSK